MQGAQSRKSQKRMLMRPTFSKQELSHICSAKVGYRSKELNPNSKATCKSHSPQNQAQPVRSGYSWPTILRTHCPDCIAQKILIQVSESDSQCLHEYLFTVVRRTSPCTVYISGQSIEEAHKTLDGKGHSLSLHCLHFRAKHRRSSQNSGRERTQPLPRDTVYISGQSIKEAYKQIKLLMAVELAKGFTNAPHFLKNFNFCLVFSNYILRVISV